MREKGEYYKILAREDLARERERKKGNALFIIKYSQLRFIALRMSLMSVFFRCASSKAKILVVKKLLAISTAHQLNQMCVFNVLKVKLRSWR